MAHSIDVDLIAIPFVIDETPYAFWSPDPKGENLEFLHGLRPSYFGYLGDLHGAVIASPSSTAEMRQFAATALRNTYAQALETFFALLGAALQAPDAPVAYVLKYREEIGSVVDKITSSGPLKTRWAIDTWTWDAVADTVLLSDSDMNAEIRAMNVQGFARQWRRLAHDFRNESRGLEHNSIKHGLRLRMGGSAVTIELPGGAGDEPTLTLPFGQSEFGSTFFVASPVENSRYNVHLRERSLGWHPDQLIRDLEFLRVSIENVVAFLKHYSGAQSDQYRVAYTTHPEAFEPLATPDEAWFNVQVDSTITVDRSALLSRAEIVASYDLAEDSDQES